MDPTEPTPPPVPPAVPASPTPPLPAPMPSVALPTPGAVTAPAHRNWWQRNWKWFVPAGCLSFVALGLIFLFCIVLFVFSAMKSSDAYKIAVARAKADPRVTEALGTPIKEGLFVSGNTNTSGGSGSSNLSIPIHGPKGAATIYAIATKEEGKWEYSKLVVKIEQSGESIDLAEEPNE